MIRSVLERRRMLVPVVGLTVLLGAACGSGETAGDAASAPESAIDPTEAALGVADLRDVAVDVRRDPG